MCWWHFLSSILQEHTRASLYLLSSRFQDTDQKHVWILLIQTSVFNKDSSVMSLHLQENTCVLTVRCRRMNPHSTLPKNPQRFSRRPELGEATALGFSGVSAVLSSVFPPVLSCSLTSEYKQETFPRADTTQRKSEYSQSGTLLLTREPSWALFFLWWTSKNRDMQLHCLQHNYIKHVLKSCLTWYVI